MNMHAMGSKDAMRDAPRQSSMLRVPCGSLSAWLTPNDAADVYRSCIGDAFGFDRSGAVLRDGFMPSGYALTKRVSDALGGHFPQGTIFSPLAPQSLD